MNTNPIVVPVFAVEAAIGAMKALKKAGGLVGLEETALSVLEQLLKDGPIPMPQGAYDALYDALKASGIAAEALRKARGKHHQD